MTCIILIIDSKRMYLGADMQGTDSTFHADYQDKIFHRGELLIGVSGSYAIGNSLRYRVKIPKLDKDFQTPNQIRDYVHRRLWRQIKETLTEDDLIASEDGELKIGGCILIGIRGMIFVIQEDFAILEPRTPYYSIGSGNPYGFATMMCLDRQEVKMHAETKVREAILIASKHCPGVSEDVLMLIAPNQPE